MLTNRTARARGTKRGVLALLTLAAAMMLGTTAASSQGYWVLEAVKLWQYAAQPNPPPPRPNRYEQDVKASGLSFSTYVTDVDNKVHPHHLHMGWTLSDIGNGVIVKAGQVARVAVTGRHSGDYYSSADFAVTAGDEPRSNPHGWRNHDTTHPAWTFRAEPVLRVHAGNGEARGAASITFPRSQISGGQPFTILFYTGIAGTAGVEYVYRWSSTVPAAPPRVTLPGDVVGDRADAARPSGTADAVKPAPTSLPPQPAGLPVVAAGAERKAILDTLRPWVQDELRQPVEFVVDKIVTAGPWAFVIATPQRPGGGTLKWSGTPCAGDVSHLVGGLLRSEGRRWSIIATALCPTDIAWADWPQTHGAPESLFE